MNASVTTAAPSTATVTAPPAVDSGLVAPLVGAYPVFLMKVLCFALFACAFNLLIGYVGLLSFGHAMFFGFAAYISAHTVKVWGWTPELGILAGTATAAVLGLVVGAIARGELR